MIYLLEDDDSIRKLVLYGLDSQGFQANGFALPSEFWRAMDAELPELVLLDIMLPEEDGLSILKKLRARPATRRHPRHVAHDLRSTRSARDQNLGGVRYAPRFGRN